MAVLTPLEQGDARRIGALYGLEVVAVRGIPAGSVNSNFALDLAGGGRAFLRVYEEQGATGASGEARLLDHLATHGVPTPRPMHFTEDPDRFIAEHAGKPVAVFPWRDGETLCQARVTPDATRQVGAALARVHVAGASYEGANPSRFGVAALAERIARLQAMELEPHLRATVDDLARRLDRVPRRRADGLGHGDLFRDNVLWVGGRICALLDFESASLESRPFDVMVTVLAWCFTSELDTTLARALFEGYASVRAMPDEEAMRLHDEGCFAALRFSITRITDFELRRGAGVYKDYRRFLARLGALEALGPTGLAALAGHPR